MASCACRRVLIVIDERARPGLSGRHRRGFAKPNTGPGSGKPCPAGCDATWVARLHGWYAAKGGKKYCPACVARCRPWYTVDVEAAKQRCCRTRMLSAVRAEEAAAPVARPERRRSGRKSPDCGATASWSDCAPCDPVWQARAHGWRKHGQLFYCRGCPENRLYQGQDAVASQLLCQLCQDEAAAATATPPPPWPPPASPRGPRPGPPPGSPLGPRPRPPPSSRRALEGLSCMHGNAWAARTRHVRGVVATARGHRE